MREHQIVINLKPEQFEELQRMARAAGSKSVNLFVRQKLIATLGLAAPGGRTSEEDEAPDLKQLTGELRRLHRELQIFVADSLSNSDYTSTLEPIPFPTAVQENFLAEGAPLMPESVGYSFRSDDVSSAFGEAQSSFAQTFPSYGQPATSYGQVTPAYGQITPDSGQAESGFAQSAPASGQTESVFAQTPASPVPSSVRPQLPGQFPPSTISQSPAIQAPIFQAATPQTTDLDAPSAVPQASGSTNAATDSSNSTLQRAYDMPPDPSAANFADPVASQPAFSIPEPPPDMVTASNAPGSQFQQPVKGPVTVQQFAENDELEDLAERAFAISPRLGQLDEPQKRFPDPLRDLLEDALFDDDEEGAQDETQDEDSGEAQDVSSEAGETEAALEESEPAELIDPESEPPVQAEVPELDQSELSAEVENYQTAEAEEFDSEENIEEGVEESGEEPESPPQSDDEPPQDPTPPDPPLQFPPPLSGGPPPRKRRT